MACKVVPFNYLYFVLRRNGLKQTSNVWFSSRDFATSGCLKALPSECAECSSSSNLGCFDCHRFLLPAAFPCKPSMVCRTRRPLHFYRGTKSYLCPTWLVGPSVKVKKKYCWERSPNSTTEDLPLLRELLQKKLHLEKVGCPRARKELCVQGESYPHWLVWFLTRPILRASHHFEPS